MARLWGSGLELNDVTTANLEFTAIGGPPTTSTTTVRTGTYSLGISSLSSGDNKRVGYQWSAAASNGPFYFRVYLRVAARPGAENRIILLNNAVGTIGTPESYITLDQNGLLRLYDEDGVIGSPSSALTNDTWYRIEILFDLSGGAGSHVVTARVDGVNFSSGTTRSISTGIVGVVLGGNLNNESNTSGDWFFDDIAVNNASGSFQNSWPGAGEVVHLKPNAAGDNNGWAKNGGGAGDSNNYQEVDEVTPDDATTNLESTALDATDDYNIEATPAAMDANDTINVIQIGTRFRSETAGTGDGFCLRVKASASGTVEESSELTPTSTTWVTNATAIPRNHALTLYDLPGASTTAWTKSDLDQAQIGIRQTDTDGAVATEVSTVWMLVDHTPAVAAAGAGIDWPFMQMRNKFRGPVMTG